MSLEAKICTLRVILVLILFVPLQGVTVKPARCPTNKIAPHKRSPYYGQNGTRTFGGAYFDLLGPGGGQQYNQGLQERPQEDDPDDCGDIEDYDETDLSSLTQPYTQQGYNDNRFFFGAWQKPGQQQTTTRAPPRPPQPPPPPRPPPPLGSPYWSGGYFSNNHYRPPVQQEPSDYVKPVHDGVHESQPTYNPDVVGGPVGHVVGARPVRPSTRPPQHTTQRTHYNTHYPPRAAPPPPRSTRPSRPRMFNNDGILGSFIDLLFK